MPACWVAQVNVTDPESYRTNSARVPAVLGKYGATFLARGARHETLECYRSSEYQEAKTFRHGAGDSQLAVVVSPGS